MLPFLYGTFPHKHHSCTTGHYPPPNNDEMYNVSYSGPPWCSIKNDFELNIVEWDYCEDECLGEFVWTWKKRFCR